MQKRPRTPASPHTDTTGTRYQKTTLDNGIRVVTESFPHVRSISVGVWANIGSRDESEQQNARDAQMCRPGPLGVGCCASAVCDMGLGICLLDAPSHVDRTRLDEPPGNRRVRHDDPSPRGGVRRVDDHPRALAMVGAPGAAHCVALDARDPACDRSACRSRGDLLHGSRGAQHCARRRAPRPHRRHPFAFRCAGRSVGRLFRCFGIHGDSPWSIRGRGRYPTDSSSSRIVRVVRRQSTEVTG